MRLLVPRPTLDKIDDLSELLGIPRPSVFRAVLVLGLGEFTHRWNLVYYDLLDKLNEREAARTPHAAPSPLDAELERVANPSGPEINALESR